MLQQQPGRVRTQLTGAGLPTWPGNSRSRSMSASTMSGMRPLPDTQPDDHDRRQSCRAPDSSAHDNPALEHNDHTGDNKEAGVGYILCAAVADTWPIL